MFDSHPLKKRRGRSSSTSSVVLQSQPQSLLICDWLASCGPSKLQCSQYLRCMKSSAEHGPSWPPGSMREIIRTSEKAALTEHKMDCQVCFLSNLCVSTQYFDSLCGNEQIHLCHRLRLSFRCLDIIQIHTCTYMTQSAVVLAMLIL